MHHMFEQLLREDGGGRRHGAWLDRLYAGPPADAPRRAAQAASRPETAGPETVMAGTTPAPARQGQIPRLGAQGRGQRARSPAPARPPHKG